MTSIDLRTSIAAELDQMSVESTFAEKKKNMKTVRLRFIAFFLLTAAVVVGCGRSEEIRSAEELRVERACRLDTTLRATLNIDSLERRAGLKTITAEAWLLVEDSTGLIISAKNANKRMFMASLTKMMTCLLTLENGKMNDSIEITEDVFVTKDSKVRPGDGYVLENLLYEMMLQSDNVAACALAKHIGGSVDTFVDVMNGKATYLGMDSTHFANPNGMPNDSNYSTARDLLILSRYCMSDTAFSTIVGTSFMDIPLTDGRHLPCRNTNLLLGKYEGCIGVKTGYTVQAGDCLVSAAERNGVRLFLVLLKSKNHSSRFTESKRLLNHGFRVMKSRNKQGV